MTFLVLYEPFKWMGDLTQKVQRMLREHCDSCKVLIIFIRWAFNVAGNGGAQCLMTYDQTAGCDAIPVRQVAGDDEIRIHGSVMRQGCEEAMKLVWIVNVDQGHELPEFCDAWVCSDAAGIADV